MKLSDFNLDDVKFKRSTDGPMTDEQVRKFHEMLAEGTEEYFEAYEQARKKSWALALTRVIG